MYTDQEIIASMADAEKNYKEDEYQEALEVAAFLFDSTEPPDSRSSEYARGVVNFLACMFAKIEVITGDRMVEVQHDLLAAHKEVWKTE